MTYFVSRINYFDDYKLDYKKVCFFPYGKLTCCLLISICYFEKAVKFLNFKLKFGSKVNQLPSNYGCLFVAKMDFSIQWKYIYIQWKVFDIKENIFRFNKVYFCLIKNIYIQ